MVPKAKTTMPRVPARHVGRPRLLALLDAAEPGGLLLVSAPAGYGKTLLLAEWAARRPDRVAWLSLDDDDSTAPRFWSAVLAALCGCAGVPPSSAVRRLVAPLFGETGSGFLLGLRAALDELAAPVDLVLDDLHELAAGSTAMRALAALVRERPPALRLVLATRTDPPLPVARMRLSGELREIRARDLAFSTDEAAALLTASEVALSPEQVRTLVDETGGWAAGLRLAALSLREAPDTERFLADLVGNSKATSDYLVGEILSNLPADTCDLLRAVSICDRLPAGLAATLADRPDAGEVLDALERETSLVLSSGEGRVWYRIHPLLRSHLRLDLQRRRPEMIARLHGLAADWLAAHGHPDAALLHARRAGDGARVAALLVAHGLGLVAAGEHAAVRDALGFLAGRAAAVDPFVALLSALVASEDGASAAVDRHLARAAVTWPDDPAPELVALRALVRSRRAGRGSDHGLIARAAAELHVAQAGAVNDPVGMGRLDLALTHVVSGQLEAARLLAEGVVADARERGHGYLGARALSVLAVAAAMEGRYRRMAQLADLAHDALTRGGWRATAGAGLAPLLGAYGALLDLRPARCLELLDSASADDPATAVFDFLAHATRAAALADLHRSEEAGVALRLARSALTAGVLPRVVPPAALLAHGVAIELGSHDVAADVARLAADTCGPTAEVVLMAVRRPEMPSGDRTLALGPVLDGTVGAVVHWTAVETHVRACDLALAADRHPQARHELEQALTVAEASGALRPLLAGGPAVRDLLARQIGSFGSGDAAAARVLKIGGAADRSDAVFTGRERDVLGLLASPRSLGEIAAELGVAPSTVKTHVRAIYSKLGVSSRRAAVAAGRRRGSAGRR